MNKKIAVPVTENDILDGHFGHCKFFVISTVLNGKVVSEEKLVPPPHEPGVLPTWLADNGVTDIIAGGMGQKAIQMLNQRGVNAFVGAPQLSYKELTQGYLNDSLSLTANYCNHKDGQECSGH